MKWLLYSVLVIAVVILLLLTFDGSSQSTFANEKDPQPVIVQKEYSSEVDSTLYYALWKEFGHNKKLAKGYEYQCLLALSHYPELKRTRIDFQLKPAFLPLASRPDPASILLPWKKRTYLVVISTESEDFFEPILLHNTPFNEQVGVLGHELGHTVFYQDKNSFQLIRIAYQYQYNNEYKIQFERDTDKRAIAHGLGYQILDFAYFVRRKFGMSEEEIEAETGGMYLSPNEIVGEMEKYTFYENLILDSKE